jgi:branched-chain amino acid transport system substrate-binding protein
VKLKIQNKLNPLGLFVWLKLLIAIIFPVLLIACGPTDETPVVRGSDDIPNNIDNPLFIPTEPQSIIVSDDETDIFNDENVIPRANIKIGIMLPLTGPTAPVGQALLNAATLALFDAKDPRLEIIPADTKGTFEGAIEAANALVSNYVDIIIGPLFSESIKASHPIMKQANIKMISFSTDHDVAGDGVYLLSFRPEEQVSRVIKYASKKGYKKFAGLFPDNLYGGRVRNIFSPLVMSEFKEIIAIEIYPPDASLLDEPVKRIANYNFRRKEYLDEMNFLRSLGRDDDMGKEFINDIRNLETLGEVEFDAILLPDGGSILGTLAPLLSYYEINLNKVKVLGTGLWDDEMLFNEPQLQGGWFAAPPNTEANIFIDRYRQAFSSEPPRLVTLGYDAMALIANIVRTQKAPDFSDKIITNPNGYMGLDGIFRFYISGLVERGLAVYEVTTSNFKLIDPAPTSFLPQEKPIYVEVPIEFKPEFDPVLGLTRATPSLSDGNIQTLSTDQKTQPE